jgi:hypothetical protein
MESKKSSEQLPQNNGSEPEQKEDIVDINDTLEKVKKKIAEEGIWATDKLFMVTEVGKDNRNVYDQIWCDVWVEKDFHEGNIQKIKEHFDEYNENSSDLILKIKTDKGDISIGAAKFTENTDIGIPAFNDFAVDQEWKTKKCVEYTLGAVLPKWRGLQHATSLFLFREGYRYIKEREADFLIFITGENEAPIKILDDVGLVPRKISESKLYQGGNCAVYAINVEEGEKNLQRINPQLYQWFTKSK